MCYGKFYFSIYFILKVFQVSEEPQLKIYRHLLTAFSRLQCYGWFMFIAFLAREKNRFLGNGYSDVNQPV